MREPGDQVSGRSPTADISPPVLTLAAGRVSRIRTDGSARLQTREAIMSAQRAWAAKERESNAKVIAEFRASGGEVAAPYDDPPPMLLVHTIGARSGREHIVPMRSLPDGDRFYVFASAHGSPRKPDWYHNIVANPDLTIEKGTETIPVQATEVHGEERDAIFARHAARFPIFTEYERKLARTIPVIRLDPRIV